jgi:hypothetical protein
MILTYYEYINENRGISNFIKKLSTKITGSISKKMENLKSDIFDFNYILDINFEEMKNLDQITIQVKREKGNYDSRFYNIDDRLNLFIEFDLPEKSNIDYYYLHELVIHEMTHLYEYYNIVVNGREFPIYDRIKRTLIRTFTQDNFDLFSYFRNLVYLTLDNELNARSII